VGRDVRGKFEPQALLRTDLTLSVQQIVEWFVLRWQLEVTFEEARIWSHGRRRGIRKRCRRAQIRWPSSGNSFGQLVVLGCHLPNPMW
jgi:hypothetical protein